MLTPRGILTVKRTRKVSAARSFFLGGLALLFSLSCQGPADDGTIPTQAVPYQADFGVGTLIVPMDTDYQDQGMLKAYGLIYELLGEGIPVYWTIQTGKGHQGADFTASAEDRVTSASITAHAYRGGPFVIDCVDAASAVPIVDAYQSANPSVVVHEATDAFTATVTKVLRSAPRIALFADGSQHIARASLQAAGIPDSLGDSGWPDTSPDVLSVSEVSGPTTASHCDGALFEGNGDPDYTNFVSMNWSVSAAQASPEVVAEVREFLAHPTHLFAQCQSVRAFENATSFGFFLTPNGFDTKAKPATVDFFNHDSPFVQLDGSFATVSGSDCAFSLPDGDAYKASGVTMITAGGYAEGQYDLWIAGRMDGTAQGIVSYLGGYQYDTAVPISVNPDSQGTRLLLNSIFASASD